MFAGRYIPEKRVPSIVPAIARLRDRLPAVRALILGDGPERNGATSRRDEGLSGVIEVPGFVASDEVDAAIAQAMCLLLPSRRERYGLVGDRGRLTRDPAAWSSPARTTLPWS